MPDGFPCPNPTCIHVFQPAQVKAGSLRCPRCGSTFNFQAPGAAQPSPAAPAKPAAPVPVVPVAVATPQVAPPVAAAPVAIAHPIAAVGHPPAAIAHPAYMPAAMPMPIGPLQAGDEIRRPDLAVEERPNIQPTQPLRRPLNPTAIIVMCSMGVIGIIVAIIILVTMKSSWWGSSGSNKDDRKSEKTPPGEIFQDVPQNFSMRIPNKPWDDDIGLTQAMRANLAWVRKDNGSRFVIFVKDYDDRLPPKADLIDQILTRFRGYFANEAEGDIAWQPRPPAAVDKLVSNGEVAGEPCLVLEFEARRGPIYVAGEVYILEHQGRAYYLLTFAPQKVLENKDDQEQVFAEWEDLRKGFKVLNERQGWKQMPRPTSRFDAKDLAGRYAKEIWRESKAEDYDARAVVALEGHDPKGEKEGGSRAGQAGFLSVLRLPKTEDIAAAAKAAQEYFTTKQAAVLGLEKATDLELTPVTDKNGVKQIHEADLGKIKGHIAKYRVKVAAGTYDRFAVIAAAPLADCTLAVFCESDWKRREFWEQEVNEVLGSLKAEK